ncbi:hypothetical protein CKO13_03115, partial [Halorhodospira neutriphila]|nr:hypothetical protein [Halorhodospira neutriphila]
GGGVVRPGGNQRRGTAGRPARGCRRPRRRRLRPHPGHPAVPIDMDSQVEAAERHGGVRLGPRHGAQASR